MNIFFLNEKIALNSLLNGIFLLTGIFNRRYDQFKPIGIRSPSISDILECDVICTSEHGPQCLFCIPAGQVKLEQKHTYRHIRLSEVLFFKNKMSASRSNIY